MTGVRIVKTRNKWVCGHCERNIAIGEIALSWETFYNGAGGYICKDCLKMEALAGIEHLEHIQAGIFINYEWKRMGALKYARK